MRCASDLREFLLKLLIERLSPSLIVPLILQLYQHQTRRNQILFLSLPPSLQLIIIIVYIYNLF